MFLFKEVLVSSGVGPLGRLDAVCGGSNLAPGASMGQVQHQDVLREKGQVVTRALVQVKTYENI